MPSAPKGKHSAHRRHDPTARSATASGSASASAPAPAAAAGPKGPKPKPIEQRDGSGVPGISKLKASIRQTKRLLAKDTLEPGLRISTQRRLTALEADLARAEKRNVEKKNGGKYHMVKFFERQKLLRIIRRLHRALRADPAAADAADPAAAAADTAVQLHHARVMLNYILHFPNEQKYISLFPPAGDHRDGEQAPAQAGLPGLPPHLAPSHAEPADPSDRRRLEILRRVQGMMERKEISGTPEEEGRGDRVEVDVAAGGAKRPKATAQHAQPEEDDDFFENE